MRVVVHIIDLYGLVVALGLNHSNFVDPLLQAIVLTAIVIGFGMTAFLLVLIYRTYRVTKEYEISALRGEEDDE